MANHSYEVWNGTDNVPAHYDFFKSVSAAKTWIAAKREMFHSIQGYYRDNRRNMIDPDDIIYKINKRY